MPIRIGLVRTCGTTAGLVRCLTALQDAAVRFSRIVVVDDSKTRQSASENRSAMQKYAQLLCPVELEYAGPIERKRFVEQLSHSSGVPRALIEFGLLGNSSWGPSDGAAMNWGLLKSLGENVLSVDDDVVLRFARSPEYRTGTRFYGVEDPRSLWVYQDNASLENSLRHEHCDIVSMHEQLLGKTVLLSQTNRRLENATKGQCVPRNQGVLQGTVRVTMSGLAGDSATSLPFVWAGLSGSSLERTWLSPASLELLKVSRSVVRVSPDFAITRHAAFMTYASAFLNQGELPPFPPNFRNNDGVFGLLISKCLVDSYFGHIPWTVDHNPFEHRTFPDHSQSLLATRKSVAGLLIDLIVSHEFSASTLTNEQRIVSLGVHLESIARQTVQSFECYLGEKIRLIADKRLTRLEEKIETLRTPPDWWLFETRLYLETARKSLDSELYIIPWDLPHGSNVGRSTFQLFLRCFSELLQAWPSLVVCAREQRG